jgi:hypothetical protein
MWSITISAPRFADEKLASLSIECPANMRTSDEFGLLVALWCGKISDLIKVDDALTAFSFGFFAGEIVVETSAGRISNQGRLELEACRFEKSQTETTQSKTDGNVGGQIGFELPKLFGFGKATADLGGHLNRTVSKIEQREGKQFEIFWRVADAGFNFWRVFGTGINKENVLENKILGDMPLCHITRDGAEAIEVTVSFRCDLRDLWFQREPLASERRDQRFDANQEERNRNAVASRVVARALNRNSLNADAGGGRGTVILAKQKLKSIRAEKSAEIG